MALSDVAVQMFRDSFINEFQGMEALRSTTMEVRGVVGDAYKFKLAGEAVMLARGAFKSDLPDTTVAYSAPTVVFGDFALNVETDIFEQAQVNANERTNLARVHAKAVGRRIDQAKIDALDASTTTNTIAAGAVNMTVEKLREASRLMNLNDVPAEGRNIAISANGLDSLLSETETTSSDFNSVKALVHGDIDTFMGFKFYTIGNRTEGGLPIAANIRTAFAWHRDAVGTAFSIDPRITVDWWAIKQSWLTISKVRLGAIELDPNGIVKIDSDET